MRIFSFIPALAVLVTAVAGVALPDTRGLAWSNNENLPVRAVRDLTNAERLRRGLPPKSPLMRRGTPVRREDPSSRPNRPDRTSNTISHRGVIQVINSASGAVLGYLASNSMKKAQLHHQPQRDGSVLTVTFKTDGTGSGTNLDLVMKNSNTGFPLLGLVQGVTDTDSVLSSGSPEFTVLAGVAKPGTTPGSPPADLSSSYSTANGISRTAETAVWTFDSSTGMLSPSWVNPDGSLPTVQSFTQNDNGIYLTGDITAYQATFSTTTSNIAFKFIPA